MISRTHRNNRRFLTFQPGGVILIVSITLLLTGCPGEQLPPLIPPGAEFAELTTEEVSQMINDRMDSFQNLSGTGKVRIQSWEEKYKFSEVFILEKPAHFRLETLGFLDQPVIFLTSDGAMLSLYSKKHNAYYRGVASQENLFKLSGINLSVEDTILVFSGNPPQLSSMSVEWGFPLSENHQYYLERISLHRNTVQRIWFDTQRFVIAYFEESMLTNGEITLKVKFDEYRAEEGAYPIPALIHIERPLDKTQVEIKYKEIYNLNQPATDQEVFTFIPPEDAEIHYIDDTSIEQIERLAPYEDFRTQE